jgi:ATP-dependent RNA helicase DeaD
MTEPTEQPAPDTATSRTDDDALRLAGIPEQLAEAMRRRGFAELTSVQRAVLDADAEERDLRISSQTGSGKTVAIGLALAQHLSADATSAATDPKRTSVLVLVPTRELAMQVRDELSWLFAGIPGVGIEVVIGGTSIGLERRALSRRPRVVVGTPGRTLDHLKSGALDCSRVEHVVLDESDRMLDMGFREELEAILEKMPSERRTHLVSATFAAGVRKLADRFQKKVLQIEGTRLGAANRDIEHVAHLVDRHGIYPAVVSTDVAARGIDVPDIELVIHADVPESADTYVHRSGRTGRAGRTGRSVLLVSPRTGSQVTRLLSQTRIETEWRPVPSATKVAKQLRKSFRQDIYERLGSEEGPSQQQIDYAKGLLEGRDPAAVVALLLEMAQPKPARAPMEIREPSARDAAPSRKAEQGFVRFKINWGERGGAAANRVLGHICRRGQIRSQLVGAIEIGPTESTFEVDGSVASRFEKLVRRPDARDPKLRIVRVGGQRSAKGHSDPAHRPTVSQPKKRYVPKPKGRR